MKNWIVFLFVLGTLHVNGQTKLQILPSSTENYLNINLITPVDPWIPRIRVGLIHSINNRWKVGAEIGYGDNFLDFSKNHNMEYALYEASISAYYFLTAKQRSREYLEFMINGIHNLDHFADDNNFLISGSFRNTRNDHVSYKESDFRRNQLDLTLKHGIIFKLSNRVGLNFYYGLGILFRNNKYSNIVSPNYYHDDEGHAWFTTYYDVQGNTQYLKINVGLEILYRLKD